MKACPECGHDVKRHNDAGTLRSHWGVVRCYHRNEGRQFLEDGEPNVCGCPYNGPGTLQYGDSSPPASVLQLRAEGLLN